MPEFMLKISPVFTKEIYENTPFYQEAHTGFYSVKLVVKTGQKIISLNDDFSAKA